MYWLEVFNLIFPVHHRRFKHHCGT